MRFIYGIRNTSNDKIYVGKTTMGKRRWFIHRTHLRNDKGLPNKHLQYAWNKYGEIAFEFIVLERCNESVLNDRESYWIQHYRSNDRLCGYNKTTGGEGWKHSEETKQKISTALRNRYLTHPGTRAGHSPTPETKLKQSKAKEKPVLRISLDRRDTVIFASALLAAKGATDSKYGSSNIARVLKGKSNTAYGYYWEYA